VDGCKDGGSLTGVCTRRPLRRPAVGAEQETPLQAASLPSVSLALQRFAGSARATAGARVKRVR